MVKLVDTPDLGSGAAMCVGSSPILGISLLLNMAFYIYDPKGFRHPYHLDWRDVRRVEETRSSTEKEEQRKHRFAEAINGMRNAPHWKFTRPKKHALLASHLMKKNIYTLPPETPIFEAWKFFCKHRFRHVPIVNQSGSLVGILSDRKILEELAQINPKPNHASPSTINDIMVTHVLTAHPDTEVTMIAKIMINERVGAMPIVDDNNQLVGIMTRTDIVRTLIKIEDFDSRV